MISWNNFKISFWLGFGETKYSEANFKDVDYLSATIDMITKNKIILIAPSRSGTFAIPFVVSKSEKVAGFVGVSPVTPGDISESSLRYKKIIAYTVENWVW